MKTVLLGLLALSVIVSSAYAKESRYYGVDRHASFSTPCNTAQESRDGTLEYEVMGIDCGAATGSYMILFVTKRFPVKAGSDIRSREDQSMSAMVDVLAENPHFKSLAQVQPAEDDNWNGTRGRSEIVRFISPAAVPGLPSDTGLVYVFSDHSSSNVIYVTEVVTMFDPSARDSRQTLQSIKDFMQSVQFDEGRQ